MADFKIQPVPRHLAVTIAHEDAFELIMTLYVAVEELNVTEDMESFASALAAGYVSNGGELPENVVDRLLNGAERERDDDGVSV